jgi:hypothetical protein
MTPEERRFLSDGIAGLYGKAFSTLRCFVDLVEKEMVAVLKARPASAWGAFEADPKTIGRWPTKELLAPRAAQVQLEGNCRGKRVLIGIGVRVLPEHDAGLMAYGYVNEQPKKPRIEIPQTLLGGRVKADRVDGWDAYIYIEPGDETDLARDFGLLLDAIVGALPNALTDPA